MKIQQNIAQQLAWFLCLFVAFVITGCVSQETAAKSPKGKLLQDADSYVSELKEQGKLPGFSSTEHVTVRLIASAPWKGGDVSYPAPVMVRIWKQGDDSTYYYALVKDTQEAPWRLTKATLCDKHDKVIERLFPK